jgi:uncharacterized protein (TIGR00369 family)
MTIPEGFERHFRTSPVTDPWEPIYSRRDAEAVQIGLTIGEAHCNARGFLHGGVIAALSDIAMGWSFVQAARRHGGAAAAHLNALTVSLSVDYLSTARIGQWLTVAPRVVHAGRSLGFADALLTADGTPIARANATFRLIGGGDDRGKPESRGEGSM